MLISPGMTIELWPHPFSLEFIVTLKDDNLRTDLRITNTGTSSFKFQSLLHTYFKVNEGKEPQPNTADKARDP